MERPFTKRDGTLSLLVGGLVLALGLLAGPDAARAEVLFQYGVGAKAGMNLNLMGEPESDFEINPTTGFVGVGGGGGLAAEALFADAVGLEVDLFYVKAIGDADKEINDINFNQHLESTELQIPVLLKGQIPFGAVKPWIGLGLTFVEQLDVEFSFEETPPSWEASYEEAPEQSYSMLTLALGVTVDAGPVRVPVELRGQYQSIGDDPDERYEFDPPIGTPDARLGVYPKWEGQIWLMVGAQYSGGI